MQCFFLQETKPPPSLPLSSSSSSASLSLSLSIFTIMGCRGSKLDVATGNTITQSKKSNADAKRIATPETQQDDKSGGLVGAAAEADDTVMMNGKEGESRELDRENEGSEEEEKEKDMERSISRESPNHYFSTRKDDESIDVIATEERSEYSSPPPEAAGEEIHVFSKETSQGAVEEMKAEGEKINEEEPGNMKEENMIKESEAMTPQAKILRIEEKNVNAGEEHITNSSKED